MPVSDHASPLRAEARAAQHLLSTLRDEGIIEADDDEATASVVDSETRVVELCAAALKAHDEDVAMSLGLAALIREYSHRAAVLEARASRIKAAIVEAMAAVGMRTMRLPAATLSVGRGRPGVRIVDENLLPDECLKPPARVPDVLKIAQALKEGREVPGATLANPRPYLIVRR